MGLVLGYLLLGLIGVLGAWSVVWNARAERRHRAQRWEARLARARDLRREERLLHLEAETDSCAVEQLIRETSEKRPAA